MREFCKGVPVRATLRSAERSQAALAWIVECSLIMLVENHDSANDIQEREESRYLLSFIENDSEPLDLLKRTCVNGPIPRFCLFLGLLFRLFFLLSA